MKRLASRGLWHHRQDAAAATLPMRLGPLGRRPRGQFLLLQFRNTQELSSLEAVYIGLVANTNRQWNCHKDSGLLSLRNSHRGD
jgi:hypothetical protein